MNDLYAIDTAQTGDASELAAALRYLRTTHRLARYCARSDHVAVMQAAAERAAQGQGDIIVTMNDKDVTSDVDLFTLLRKDKVGDTITFTIDRKGATSTVTVTLGQRPQQ